jgi:hypothetical protein
MREIKKLYRKVNTKARHSNHNYGSEARYSRNTKEGISKNMKKGVQRGLDFTPLYKFLLSKVGKDWDKVYSEAVSRLDGNEHAIWHTVKSDNPARDWSHITDPLTVRIFNGVSRVDESTQYSKLHVVDGKLEIVDPGITNEMLTPSCPCCTHTFNGKVLVKKFFN